MKTLTTILLSCLVLFQSAGISISDTFKLIDLVEHTKYHSQEYGDDCFTFFEKHYGALKTSHQKNHKEEKSQHERLPFQHINANHSSFEVVVMSYEFYLDTPILTLISNSHFYYQNLYSYLKRPSVFQPPQSV
ncbi:hypothetical protein ACFFU9_02980 [Mariniflexile ostreae]|uniref:Uncharacterized protein n=1 Tax=Mariniflexile ostreae TaxID=1520892 RepID=A0ABV5F8C7_9FLAO